MLQTVVRDVGLSAFVLASCIVVPLFLSHNANHKWVFEGITWQPLGLCLGLLSTAVGQVGVLLYHRLTLLQDPAELKSKEVQRGRVPVYSYWDGVKSHISQPEGLLLLASYLSGTWVFGLMGESYYSFEGGVDVGVVCAQLVVQDFLQTMMHLAEHRLPSLYVVSHKPHHRFKAPRLFDAFNGSLCDTLFMIVIPLFATQMIVPSNVWSYMTFGSILGAWLTLIHSEWTHPWEKTFRMLGLGTTGDHHVHHAIFVKNFGHFFLWWDMVLGTYADANEVFAEQNKAAEIEENKTPIEPHTKSRGSTQRRPASP